MRLLCAVLLGLQFLQIDCAELVQNGLNSSDSDLLTNVISLDENESIGNGALEDVKDDCDTDPEVVLGFQMKSFSDEFVEIAWRKPQHSECLNGYILKSAEASDIPIDANATSYIYESDNTCSIFKTILYTTFGPDHNLSRVGVPITLPKVQDIEKSAENRTIILTWKPNEIGGKCAEKYHVNIWNQDNDNRIDTDTLDTNFTIDEIIGCMDYNYQIQPMIGLSQGQSDSQTFNVDGLPTTPPNVTATEVSKTSANLKVVVDSYKINMCTVSAAAGFCEAPETNNSNADWIIREIEIQKNLTDDNRQFEVKVSDLSPFTNYSCKINVTNVGGDSDYSEEVVFRTDEDVTSPPINVTFSEIKPTGFKVTWEEPEIVPGIISNYKVDIIQIGPIHSLPEYCEDSNENYTETLDETTYEFTFEKGKPHYNYTVQVRAIDGAGESDPAEASTETAADAPEAPKNVNHESHASNEGGYNVTEEFTWEEPCQINGELQYFVVEINGNSQENKDTVYDNATITPSKDFKYNYIYGDTRPFFSYVVKIYAVVEKDIKGAESVTKFNSAEGIPDPPENVSTKNSDKSVDIKWDEPKNKYGIIKDYTVTIINFGPNYDLPTGCHGDYTNLSYTTPNTSYTTNDVLSFYKYSVYVNASTSSGYGNASEPATFTTNQGVPETVRNLKGDFSDDITVDDYNVVLKIKFDPPCNPYGKLVNYLVNIHSSKSGADIKDEQTNINSDKTEVTITNITPEYEYIINVTSVNENKKDNTTESFTLNSPLGYPIIYTSEGPSADGTEKAVFKFSASQVNESRGDIQKIEYILEEKSDHERYRTFGKWDSNNAPKSCITENCSGARRLAFFTFKGISSEDSFTIGEGSKCEEDKTCDNSLLKPDTEYSFVLRAYTSETYRDSDIFNFITDSDGPNLGLILGLTFGLLAACAIGVFIFILWRKRKQFMWLQSQRNDKRKQSVIVDVPGTPQAVPVKKFISYYNELKDNYDKQLKPQYTLLVEKSKDFLPSITYAILTENKRKNRYSNILPYDENRVKLKMDEDDENSTDYINASYIKGYSKKVEYIATQGPLPETHKDFWKMVMQENVTVIVMVSQFIEQEKEKCYKYFPNHHEVMTVGGDMEVKCVTELLFGIYCIRIFQVRKGLEQRTVTHMQFLEWPDFGVPSDTENILQFCQLIRDKAKKDGGLIAVHCSAGVGRTGTIICLDMLLQAIREGENINIFETILNLRKQRVNMVQTHEQYFYIHSCLKDNIENPVAPNYDSDTKIADPFYENLQIHDIDKKEEPSLEEVTSVL